MLLLGTNLGKGFSKPLERRMGFDYEKFTMDSGGIIVKAKQKEIVRNREVVFYIKIGSFCMSGKTYQKTFMLEIDYSESENKHLNSLFLRGFGSCLHYDYAEQVHKVAEKFVKEGGYVFNTHLNSWPIFRAIVSSPE